MASGCNDSIVGEYYISLDGQEIVNSSTCSFDGEYYTNYSYGKVNNKLKYRVSNDTIFLTKILKNPNGSILLENELEEKFICKGFKGDTLVLWDTFIEMDLVLIKK